MTKMMTSAIRKWRKMGRPIPNDGMMIIISYKYTKQGKYQCDLVHDSRFYKYPRMFVYFFKPGSFYFDYSYSKGLKKTGNRFYVVY